MRLVVPARTEMLRLSKLPILLALWIGSGSVALGDLPTAEQVSNWVEQLDADSATDRKQAEVQLFALAEEAPDSLLMQLPEPDPRMPATIRAALSRLRLAIEQQIALRATQSKRVSLQFAQAPLVGVLAEMQRQTGNRLIDGRTDFGGPGGAKPITVTVEDVPFWSALDAVLDAGKLGVYAYGEEGAITLIDRLEGERRRVGKASYSGPFRFEPLRLVATNSVRNRSESNLRLDIEVAWEPRLQPIAVSQSLNQFTVTTDNDIPLVPQTPEQSIDLEASPGTQTLELNVTMNLPVRSTQRIESIQASLTALVPATKHTFRFKQIGAAERAIVQSRGDATVTFERFRLNNAIWELHMRLQLAKAGDALASHRGWVFRNLSYLVDAQGNRYEHAGFETTMQTESEVGVAYLFDLSGDSFEFDTENGTEKTDVTEEAQPVDPKELTWVYETPTGVYSVPVEYELGPIDLP